MTKNQVSMFYFCNRRNAKRYEKKDNKAEESGKPGKNVNTGTEKKRAQEPDTIESAPLPERAGNKKTDPKDHMLMFTLGQLWETCARKSQATQPAA